MEATVLLLVVVANERGGLTPNALTIVDDDRNSKRIDETFMISWMMRIDKVNCRKKRNEASACWIGDKGDRSVYLVDDGGVSKV
jgi:hypothetical protein